MKQASCEIDIQTRGKGLYNFTARVQSWVEAQGCRNGLLTVFVRHTSASLTIQENADRDVLLDLNDFFSRVVPEDDRLYRHTTEGPDDMPAHIRAALTQTQLSIPVVAGSMALGTWQGLYLFEHRHGGQKRQIVLHLIGE
jgi:secondary thiamine-phosphate synthase enzyme